MRNIILILITLTSLFSFSQNKIPKDFPSNYVIHDWKPSHFNGSYIFYENNNFAFKHEGINKRVMIDLGTWSYRDSVICIIITKTVGLRPIGEPLNPEYSDAANPDDYYNYEAYEKFEEWKNDSIKIELDRFIFCDCYIDSTVFASDLDLKIQDYILNGKYKIASCKLLEEKDLIKLSKKELRLMRNEIFARYGYHFKSDDLKEYFDSKNWYFPKDVTIGEEYLTKIEKENIRLIKEFEENFN